MTVTPTRPPKPLLCRLNLHHRWRPERSPDGEWYRRCANCGKEDPGSFTEKTVDLIGPGGGCGIGGGGSPLEPDRGRRDATLEADLRQTLARKTSGSATLPAAVGRVPPHLRLEHLGVAHPRQAGI